MGTSIYFMAKFWNEDFMRRKPAAVTMLTMSILLSVTLFWFQCDGQIATLDGKPTIILISIDGFRWDYPEKTSTPNLDFLIKTGVRAERMIPAFPTKTFPNHHTIVTGLYPDEHGIIANNMYDPEWDEWFSLSNDSAVHNSRWWGGEPIWATAEKQGVICACFFWPGSSTKIAGEQPTHYFKYDGSVSNETRVQQVLTWLDFPVADRPSMIITYFSTIDDVGHDYGPDSPEMLQAIAYIDSLLGQLIAGLEKRKFLDKVNLIIVSDHGMAAVAPERVIFLDDFVAMDDVRVIDWSPIVALNPKPGEEDAVYSKLRDAHPRLQVYRKNEVPERFHYGKNAKIPEIVGIADEGWTIGTHRSFESSPHYFRGGTHGYDNQLISMGATFIARGPAFKSGVAVEPFENIHVYNLMAEILKIKPALNSGRIDSVRAVLR
jgi:predicted AlkP superfamily pyrophosphatase or phosphodiesterase